MDIPEWSMRGARLAQQVAPRVVAVQCGRNQASGWLWNSTHVVTVEHVIHDAPLQVTLADGRQLAAQTVGLEEGLDLALLCLEEEVDIAVDPGARPARSLLPGEWVMALARSASDGLGVATGVLSCASGPWTSCRGGEGLHFVQPDLNLYPGFSGGALIDAAGGWIGLNTRGLSRYQPITLSVADVQQVIERLLKGPEQQAYLGVGLHSVEVTQGRSGAMIVSLEPDSPAARAGLLQGDILLSLASHDTPGTPALLGVLKQLSPGQQVEVAGIRAGTPERWQVELGQRRQR